MRTLGLILLLTVAACKGSGPCGDPVIRCYTADESCPPNYTAYTGAGDCPGFCVDPRRPAEDAAIVCRDMSSSMVDMTDSD